MSSTRGSDRAQQQRRSLYAAAFQTAAREGHLCGTASVLVGRPLPFAKTEAADAQVLFDFGATGGYGRRRPLEERILESVGLLTTERRTALRGRR